MSPSQRGGRVPTSPENERSRATIRVESEHVTPDQTPTPPDPQGLVPSIHEEGRAEEFHDWEVTDDLKARRAWKPYGGEGEGGRGGEGGVGGELGDGGGLGQPLGITEPA